MGEGDWKNAVSAFRKECERRATAEERPETNNWELQGAYKLLHSFHTAEFGDYVVFPKSVLMSVYRDVFFQLGQHCDAESDSEIPMWAREFRL